MKVKRKCKFCGKEFEIKSKHAISIQKYCCRYHAVKAHFYVSFKEYKNKLKERVCKLCGKKFTTTSNNRKKIFCSKECMHKFHSHQRHITDPRKSLRRGTIRTCLCCGKKYSINKNTHGRYFCSIKCYYKFRKVPSTCKFCGEPIRRRSVKKSNCCNICSEIY